MNVMYFHPQRCGTRRVARHRFVAPLVMWTALAGCASLPGTQQSGIGPLYEDVGDERVARLEADRCGSPKAILSPRDRFLCADLQAPKSAGSADGDRQRLQHYMDEGFAYSDWSCQRWFNALERLRRETEMAQGRFQILGTLTTTSMAIFRSATREIAAASAAFGATDSSYNLAKTTLLLTPSLGKLEAQVIAGREALAAKMRAGESTASYGRMKALLVKYHQTCSTQELQRIVDASLDLARYGPGQAEAADAEVEARIRRHTEAIDAALHGSAAQGQSFPASVAKELYILVFVSSASKATNASPTASDLHEKYKAAETTDAVRREVRRHLSTIADLAGFGALPEQASTPAVAAFRGSTTEANDTLRMLREMSPAPDRTGEYEMKITTAR